MTRKKTFRRNAFNELSNCFNLDAGLKGRWHAFFGNHHPITLELGCGKADFSLGLARLFPERNFIGVDLKTERMWVAAKKAQEDGIPNIAFLRAHIRGISQYFSPGEVAEIWITFPDPFEKDKQAKHRMMHKAFLDEYRQIMKLPGTIQLKTDNDVLAAFVQEHYREIRQPFDAYTDDLHHSPYLNEVTGITTDFERRFLATGKNIHYFRFTLQ